MLTKLFQWGCRFFDISFRTLDYVITSHQALLSKTTKHWDDFVSHCTYIMLHCADHNREVCSKLHCFLNWFLLPISSQLIILFMHLVHLKKMCYNFSYFVLFTYVFSLFLEVSHGAATLTHFSLTHITATLLTHSTAIVLTYSIAILIALPHWYSIYSGQFCRLFSS